MIGGGGGGSRDNIWWKWIIDHVVGIFICVVGSLVVVAWQRTAAV